MKTKVAIKSSNITPFGGIFYVMDEYSRLGMSSLIDRVLGIRCTTYGYQYSEILSCYPEDYNLESVSSGRNKCFTLEKQVFHLRETSVSP